MNPANLATKPINENYKQFNPKKQVLFRSRHQLLFSNGRYVAFLKRAFGRCAVFSFDSEENVRSSFEDFDLQYDKLIINYHQCSIETVGIFFNYPRDHFDRLLEIEMELEVQFRFRGNGPLETRRFQG